METWMETLRWVHAALGVVCLVTGSVAMMSKKSRGRHPLAGRVFVVALMLVYGSILLNMVVKRNVFLISIGGIALYSAIEGWRALLRFKGMLAHTAQPLDWVVNGVSAVFSIGLLGFGAVLFADSGSPMGLVCIGFGILGCVLVRGAVQRYRVPPDNMRWLAVHIGAMSGAFSAALTAFVAVQFSGRLGSWEWVVWVAPTVLLMSWARREEARMGLR